MDSFQFGQKPLRSEAKVTVLSTASSGSEMQTICERLTDQELREWLMTHSNVLPNCTKPGLIDYIRGNIRNFGVSKQQVKQELNKIYQDREGGILVE